MQKEGQVSIEAMVSIAIMIMIFLFALGFTFSKRSELLSTEKYLEKRKECSSVANAITQTKLLGDNAETVLKVISNVSIYNKSMLIAVQDRKEIAYCTIEKLRIGNYTNLSGNLLIKNINGKINITKII